jgi:2'-5' RNA ligase
MVTRNIVLLPPPNIAQQAMNWSRQISRTDTTDFVLDGKKFYPHITVYQAAYPQKNISLVESRLAELVKHMHPFQVHAENFSTIVGFVSLDFIKTKELVLLHEHIVDRCNPLREGEIIPAEAKNLLSPLVPEYIKHSIRTYGSALDMEVFAPHITLTRLQQFDLAKNAESHLKFQTISFEVHSLWIANIGIDGTVNELLKEFPFG